MAIRTGVEGKPWYIGLAAGLGVAVVLLGLGYWQIISPMQDTIEAQKSKLKELQQKIQEGRTAQAQLPQFREEVRQLELELDKLLRILPARRNTPDLLRRIRALAEQGDFVLKRFTPGPLSDKDFYSEWPIEVDVEGTYHNLALFFDRISRFSRIINVENLEIKALPQVKNPKAGAEANPHTINAKFTAKTFVYKEPEPEDTTPKDKKGKGKAPAAARPTPPPGSPGSEEGPTTRSRPGGPE
jgi:type IV pilus assembly protein PilO